MERNKMDKNSISVVIPAYNEEQNIVLLYKQLSAVLKGLNHDYEIIFVDDGSKDSTLSKIKEIRKKDQQVKFISFNRNFRKASALVAGLSRAKGEWVITMDADLQDDPNEIPKLIKKAAQGYDMVVGWKFPRKDPFHKILASRIFNWLVRRMSGLTIHDCDCNFRIINKKVIPHLKIYSGLYRYIPVLAHHQGFLVTEEKVRHHERKYGKSKYSATRLFSGFFDLLTIKFLLKYNKKPLHFFGGIGSLFLLSGMVTGAYLLYVKFLQHMPIGQRPLLILTMLLVFLGIQFLSIGLIGEMVADIGQKKDEYVVKEEQGF